MRNIQFEDDERPLWYKLVDEQRKTCLLAKLGENNWRIGVGGISPKKFPKE